MTLNDIEDHSPITSLFSTIFHLVTQQLSTASDACLSAVAKYLVLILCSAV